MKDFLRQSPEVIEGIGPAYAAALHTVGIETLADLLSYEAATVAAWVPRATETRVARWRAAASLLQLDGVTPDVAEALVDAGLDAVGRLAAASLRTVEKALAEAEAAHRIGEAPDLYALSAIQLQACRRRDTGMLTGHLLDAEKHPRVGVTVRAARKKSVTDDAGRFAFVGLPAGDVTVRIEHGGLEVKWSVGIPVGHVASPVTFHLSQAPPDTPPPTHDEHDGGLFSLSAANKARLALRPLDAFPDDTYFLVRKENRDETVRLLHLFRTQTGPHVEIARTDVAPDQLPPHTRPGTVLHYQAGRFTVSDLTPRDVAVKKLEAVLGPHTLHLRKRLVPLRPDTRTPRL